MLPPPTAVTSPVEEIVATAVFEDVHGVVASGVPEPVNCKVDPPTAMFCAPVIVGTVLTLTVIAVRGLSHGLEFIVESNLKAKSCEITLPFIYPAPFV